MTIIQNHFKKYEHAAIRTFVLEISYFTVLLAVCVLSISCNDKRAFSCETGTDVLLKDSCNLSIRIEFCFNNEKSMKKFKYKKKEIMFGLRLALKQHDSSMLRGMGKRNVINAIKSISKQLLKEKVARIKIIEYNFTDNKKHS